MKYMPSRGADAAIPEVDRAHLGRREDAMLSQGGKHLGGRLGQPQPRCRLPTHADLQARDRLTARCCEASAEPVMIVCGSGVARM